MSGENEYLIRSDGSKYPLAYFGANVVGIGTVPIEHLTRRGYKQHGVTHSSFRLTPRTITFAFEVRGRQRSLYWQQRQRLIDALNPEYGMVTYRRVMPDGSRRDIEGILDADMSMNESFDGHTFEAGFSLFCPDPTFFDPATQSELGVVTAAEAFILPFAVPDDLWFGGGTQLNATIDNPGSWRAYPVITISGPYERIVCANSTTGARFVLGTTLAAGSTIVVDLTPGAQTIKRNGALTYDELEEGNLVDWYLARGSNSLVFSGSGITASTGVQIAYQPRYLAL